MKQQLLATLVFVISSIMSHAQWIQLNSGMSAEVESVHMHDANNVVIGTGVGIYVSNNGGVSWTSTLPVEIYDISFINPLVGFAAGGNGLVYKTTDGGNAWTPQQTGNGTKLRAIHFYDANIGTAAGESGVVISTTDGGITWSLKNSGTSVRLLSVRFTSPTVGYIGGRNGVLLKTTDGGNNWLATSAGTGDDISCIFYLNATTGFLAVEDGILLKTTDGGTTYIPIQTSTASDVNGIYFLDPMVGYATGFLGTIIKTIDGGNTWSSESSPTMNEMSDIHFYDPNHGFAVGDLGTVLKFGSSTGLSDYSDAQARLVPNPSGDYFIIQSSRQGAIQIQIIDAIGNQISVLNAQMNQKIRHGISNPGIYLLKVKPVHGDTFFRKVVLN